MENRNTEIYQDRKAGLSWTQLIVKYGLSQTSLKRIIKNEYIKETLVDLKKDV